MPSVKKSYVCSNCGVSSPVWSGKCLSCQEWNTLEEVLIASGPKNLSRTSSKTPEIISLNTAVKNIEDRYKLSEPNISMVLGGGIVRGSVMLLTGQPGIGKSTILLQIAEYLDPSKKTVYISGEESAHQVALRAKRLSISNKNLSISETNDLEEILSLVNNKTADLVIVDSIQTLSSRDISSNAGSISQITTCTHYLIEAAKKTNTSIIIVGHVTKEGNIAGPKLLEHLVDVVLLLEGDKRSDVRLLRSTKNRFGNTNEIALFEMDESGLKAVDNPSAQLLKQRQNVDGSVVFAAIEGSRAVLVEVQALVTRSSFGYPKRTCSGFDLNRLNLLVAVLEKRTKLTLSDMDIFVNVVGGIKLSDNSSDLAVSMAIASARKGMSLKSNCVVFGEIGLGGEVRHVASVDKRIAEARSQGFEAVIMPDQITKTNKITCNKTQDLRSTLNKFLK